MTRACVPSMSVQTYTNNNGVYDDISICLPDFFNEIVSVRKIFFINKMC
jgi:hypothetical protein